MNTAKLNHYRERLLEERNELVHAMDRIRESIPEEVRPPGEHEIAPSEGIDVELSLATGEGSRLGDIDAALDRIRDGTFGKCCNCGKVISEPRLEAVPEARYCIRCDASFQPR